MVLFKVFVYSDSYKLSYLLSSCLQSCVNNDGWLSVFLFYIQSSTSYHIYHQKLGTFPKKLKLPWFLQIALKCKSDMLLSSCLYPYHHWIDMNLGWYRDIQVSVILLISKGKYPYLPIFNYSFDIYRLLRANLSHVSLSSCWYYKVLWWQLWNFILWQ